MTDAVKQSNPSSQNKPHILNMQKQRSLHPVMIQIVYVSTFSDNIAHLIALYAVNWNETHAR